MNSNGRIYPAAEFEKALEQYVLAIKISERKEKLDKIKNIIKNTNEQTE
jgi:hypothetical protein